ncbi:hypothetical protein HIM_09357 [Hirsutella minnesotensis 3608]|uniref:CDP-diacylglycerol--glycerol-3-phosphate 3-phosphatidyltransferase n=1 Tax=Hirsutella minnesotensis 3608 TaxID=1043627 RepID=A0A0F8A364_9HYPO|nr:hypothetical protein HIM_09357 [Hirsutella minnesotensis 3608]
MLVRRCASGCAGRVRPAAPRINVPSPARFQCRRYATPSSGGAGAAASSAPINGVGALAPIVSELDKMAPSFDVRQQDIQILETPAEFYETLKGRIRNARRRIFLSTLYIGKSERDLIDTLHEALRRNPDLQLSILTDALRGTREAPRPSCASHHMKLYGVDDEVILSGANLSTDYFTNRQDRYHLFSCKQVTDFFWRLHSGVASFSFLVEPSAQDAAGFTLTWPSTNTAPSPLDKPQAFVASTTKLLHGLLKPSSERAPGPLVDTRVYMLGQMSQLLRPDSSTELPVVTRLLEKLAEPTYRGSSWTFTAGYFNPASSLTKLLLGTASHHNTVITAAPEANGFYRSRGVSGMLPDAYVLLARRFLDGVRRAGRGDHIALKEWRRGTVGQPGGWSYHAKGLWVTLPGDADPAVTVIGSSNYTRRSYSLDLEAGALVVTRGDALRRRLGEEQRWLQEHAREVTRDDFARNDRRVGLHVRVAMWIVQLVGGAL